MPKMPLAPNCATVSSAIGTVEFEQSAGTGGERLSPISCTGTECADSPEICTSTRDTGPQL